MGKQNDGFYSKAPVVSKGKMPKPVVGLDVTRIVPKREPRATGLAGLHGYGHPPYLKIGKLRLSGGKGAHRVGKR